jgi:hypothetical protein
MLGVHNEIHVADLPRRNHLDHPEREECYKASIQLAHQLKANGQYLAANPLQPTALATSVRIRGGKRLITDGSFAETREQLGLL